jgi:hypothetical protein
MRNLGLILAVLVASAPVAGQSEVPAVVHSVVSGGYWQSEHASGNYRIVLVNTGFEHVTTRVFVEWVAGPANSATSPSILSSVEPKLPFGQNLASLDATLTPLSTGKVRIVLSGVVSAEPSRKVRAVFVATNPGVIEDGG